MSKNKKSFDKVLNQRGFTLIELLVTIGIMAGLMGLAISFIGSSFHSQVKKETSHLIGSIRYAYAEAIDKKRIYRLVFDFDEQSYWLESNDELTAIRFETREEKEEREKKEEKKRRLDDKLDDDSDVKTVDTSSYGIEDNFLKKRKLHDSVRLKSIFVSHQEELVAEKKAFLYFFPKGLTELAIIHFSNEDEDDFYSLIVNPMTAAVRVETSLVDYESLE